MAVKQVPAALHHSSSVSPGTRLQVTVLPAGHKFCLQLPAGLNKVQEKKKPSRTTSQSETLTFRMHTSGLQINFPLRNLLGNTKKTSLPSCTWS